VRRTCREATERAFGAYFAAAGVVADVTASSAETLACTTDHLSL
jgi:hypothetical protein